MPKLSKSKKKLLILVCLLVLALATVSTFSSPTTQDTFVPKVKAQSIPAFPGAEGFGAHTVGGRGGRVIEVTNLNDSGSGSLRTCIEASGPRTCVFRTGGTIELSSALYITNPYITIAGQTAPGGGITLKGKLGIWVKTNDVIIRYIASRPGPGGMNNAILIADKNNVTRDVIIDHCSLSWATDEMMSTWYAVQNISIQWSIISEGLHCSTHPQGCHSKGSLLGSANSGNFSVHHNIYAHNNERNPLIKTAGPPKANDVVNNIIYNPGYPIMFTDSYGVPHANVIGNFLKWGPYTSSGRYEVQVWDNFEGGSGGASLYLSGNIGPHRLDNSQPEDLVVYPPSRQYVTSSKHNTPLITTTSAFDAYNQVLAGAGATIGLDSQGNSFWRRDAIDQRIINDVKNGTGGIIDDPSQVGGWLTIASGTPYTDTDHDGMADEWENNHFGNLSRGSASDSSSDYDSDGYTDLEEFLNGTNPKDGSPLPSPTPTPPTPPTPTPSPTPTPPSHCPPLGDIDCSGKINSLDFGYLVAHWGTADPQANLNDTGVVDAADVLILLGNYGRL